MDEINQASNTRIASTSQGTKKNIETTLVLVVVLVVGIAIGFFIIQPMTGIKINFGSENIFANNANQNQGQQTSSESSQANNQIQNASDLNQEQNSQAEIQAIDENQLIKNDIQKIENALNENNPVLYYFLQGKTSSSGLQAEHADTAIKAINELKLESTKASVLRQITNESLLAAKEIIEINNIIESSRELAICAKETIELQKKLSEKENKALESTEKLRTLVSELTKEVERTVFENIDLKLKDNLNANKFIDYKENLNYSLTGCKQ